MYDARAMYRPLAAGREKGLIFLDARISARRKLNC
jgi:hypothetical protein